MKRAIVILVCMLSVAVLQAQEHKAQRMEKMRAQKVAFLTQKMNLSPEEAQVFWPVYNEFAEQREDLNKRKRDVMVDLKQKGQEATEAQKEAVADQMIAFRMEEAQLDKKYHEQFKKVLPIDKVLKLYRAEMQFKNYLMQQIRRAPREQADRPERPARKARAAKPAREAHPERDE